MSRKTTPELKALDPTEPAERWMEKWQHERSYEGDLVALHRLLMAEETSPAVMKEFAYGNYCDARYGFENCMKETDPLADYVALSPYFKAVRWRDYCSWQVIRGRIRKYRRYEAFSATFDMREIKENPLIIIAGAGLLPVVRRFDASIDYLSDADVIACDTDAGVSREVLDKLFQKKFGIVFPDSGVLPVEEARPSIQYQECTFEELYESGQFLGKADVVVLDGVLMHYPNGAERQQIVQKALYLLKPDGVLSCDLMTKFPEMKDSAKAFGIKKGDRLERTIGRAKNSMMQICANLGTTMTWRSDSSRNAPPIAVHFELSPPRQDLDYRLAIGEQVW